jgi:hypothetical protein
LDQIFSKTPFALLLDSPFQHHPLALFWTSPPLTVWEVYGYSCCMHSSRPVSFFCTIQPAPQKLKGEVRGFTSWEIRKLQGISTSKGIRELQEASQSWGIRNFHKQLREREEEKLECCHSSDGIFRSWNLLLWGSVLCRRSWFILINEDILRPSKLQPQSQGSAIFCFKDSVIS